MDTLRIERIGDRLIADVRVVAAEHGPRLKGRFVWHLSRSHRS